jgi:hypothetical protein
LVDLVHTGEPVKSGTKYTMRTELLYQMIERNGEEEEDDSDEGEDDDLEDDVDDDSDVSV